MPASGDKLKEARLKQGLTLKEISEKTRIQVPYLEALESGQPEVIPGAFFRKSFTRQYAEFLGLNPDEFLDTGTVPFGSFGESADAPPSGHASHGPLDLPPLPTPGRQKEFPVRQVVLSIGLLVGVIAICAAIYTFWEDLQNAGSGKGAAPVVENLPAPAAEPPAAEAPSGVAPGVESSTAGMDSTGNVAEPGEAAPSASESASAGAENAGQPNQEETPAAAAVQAPTVLGTGTRELRLSADALTWVRVREGDRTLFVGTLEQGQTRTIRVNEGAQVLTGNAGALNVNWQGKDLGTIGPVGQIRTVIVTPEETNIVAPAPKPQNPNTGGTGASPR